MLPGFLNHQQIKFSVTLKKLPYPSELPRSHAETAYCKVSESKMAKPKDWTENPEIGCSGAHLAWGRVMGFCETLHSGNLT